MDSYKVAFGIAPKATPGAVFAGVVPNTTEKQLLRGISQETR
jgi:hypothetical protein